MRSLFAGRRAQVLHSLLAHHQNWFGVKGLAEQTLVSPATASQVLTEMERCDWLASPIQVYLDLLRGEGRAKEMAEHLRRVRIGF